jgi:L-malate glycosyltransferase
LRVLITPDWYPWPEQPLMGVFCREHAHAISRVADVTVLTWRLDTRLRVPFRLDESNEDGLRTFRLRFSRTRVPKSGLGFKLAGSFKCLLALRREGWTPEIVHAHEYGAAPVALSLGAITRAPVVFSEHYSGFALGTLPERERRRATWAFERGGVVCPVSEDLARHVKAIAPRARVQPVPNVVDTDIFAPDGLMRPASLPRLVTVGSLVEIKGHRHLILAIAQLRGAGLHVTLDIVGDGPLRADLERLACEHGVSELVRFHGRKEKREVAEALRQADVFVLPSLWENLPCALLEAMSVGLPTVATRVGGVPEILDSGQGILVNPGSPVALAEGLGQIMGRLADYDREALRAKAVAGFGYEAIGRRWANIYASAVGND